MNQVERVAEDSARGSFFLTVGSAVSTVIMAIQAIVIGNLLGPELYGQYTLAFLVPNVIYIATDLGLATAITRFVAEYNVKGESARIDSLIRRTLIVKCLIVIPLFIVDFVFASWFASLLGRPFLSFDIALASIFVPFLTVSTIISSVFIGLDKAEYAALLADLSAIINTTISVELVIIGLGIAGSIIGTVVACAVTGVVSILLLLVFLPRRPRFQSIVDHGVDFRKMLSYSMPLYISSVFSSIIPYYQYAVLAGFAGDVNIGSYKAALNFAALITIVSGSISTVLLPAFCKLETTCTMEEIRTFFKIGNKYSALLVMPVTLFMIVFSNQIIGVVYRYKFPLAAEYLAISCLVYLLAGMGYVTLTSFFSGLSQTRNTLAMAAVTLIVLLVSSPILALVLGAPGVIVASTVAGVAGTIYGAVRARRLFSVEFDIVSVLKVYAVAGLACIPSFLIIRFVHFPRFIVIGPNLIGVVLAGLVFLMLYATFVPLVRVLSVDELHKVIAVTNKSKSLSFFARPVLKYVQIILQRMDRTKST
jgi:O-antigen/teichoic acid export membrane protein